jgi:hypothetical protein
MAAPRGKFIFQINVLVTKRGQRPNSFETAAQENLKIFGGRQEL